MAVLGRRHDSLRVILFFAQFIALIGYGAAQSLSMTPSQTDLTLKNENDTFHSSSSKSRPDFKCFYRGQSFTRLRISRALLNNQGLPGTKEEIAVVSSSDVGKLQGRALRGKAGFENVTMFMLEGTVDFYTGTYIIKLSVNLNHMRCIHQAMFFCQVEYTDVAVSTEPIMKELEERLSVKPFNRMIEFIEPKSSGATLSPGQHVRMVCRGNVGTLHMGGETSQLVWAYMTDGISAHDLIGLEGSEWQRGNLTYGPEIDVNDDGARFCTKRQEITIDFYVHKERDTRRTYHCCVRRVSANKKVTFEAFTPEQYIVVPDFFPYVADTSLGVAGTIGLVGSALAFLAIGSFGFIWFIKVKAKKAFREEEIHKMKQEIDDRRTGIVKIVESRKHVGVEEAEESSVGGEN